MRILENYKTSVPAFLVLACVGLRFANIIDSTQLAEGVALLTGVGLLGSKDFDKK